MKPTAESIFLTFSTFPSLKKDDIRKYLDSIDTDFGKLKSTREKNFENNNDYNYLIPFHFYLLSSWDLCTIVASDNSVPINEILNPEAKAANIIGGYNNSKLHSGFFFEDFPSPTKIKDSKNNLIAITNLKISNKWLIGNGNLIIKEIFLKIKAILNDSDFLIFQNYSAYEITVIILENEFNTLSSKILNIRELCYSDLPRNTFNSLYSATGSSNLFSDSNTVFGIRFTKTANEYDIDKDLSLDISVYIQEEIRPGHFRDLKKHSYDKYKIQPGRYDLISDITKIDKSNELFIHNDNRDKISSFIRTHKTTIIYDYSQKTNQEDNSKVVIPEDDINNKEEQVDLKNIFKNKLPPLDEDGQIDLRKIKTSKAVRGQIIKLFQNFRNQFNDTVNLNLFLDILPFVWDFSELIKSYSAKIDQFYNENSKVNLQKNELDILEINLSKRIKIFYEAYYLRIVNEHSIENVGDFFIHNAQFQTIATIYDNLVKILGNHILGNHKGDKIVATFDDNTTIVNSINIKLSTYNLMEPGLILTYIFKEIITVFVDQNLKPNIENLNSEIKKAYDIYFTEYPTDPLIHYQNTLYQIKSDYFLTDFLRYKIFYEISNDDIDNEGISKDFKLFYYWHLANFLQFPKTYRLIGDVFKEKLFIECYRLNVLVNLLNDNKLFQFIKNTPPINEVRMEWKLMCDQINTFISILKIEEILGRKNYLNYYLVLIRDNILTKKDTVKDFSSLNAEFKDYLKKVKDKDGNVPSILARNWKTGHYDRNISYQFSSTENKPYFLFDQQGGNFYYDFDKMNEFSVFRNEFLLNLYDLSCKYKKIIYDTTFENIYKYE